MYQKEEKWLEDLSDTIGRIKDGIIDGTCDFVRPSQLSPRSLKTIGKRVKIKLQAKSTHEEV